MNGNTCGACHTFVPYPAIVCTGCQGSCVYGATAAEMQSWFNLGFVLVLLVSVGVALRFYHMSLEVLIGCVLGALAGGLFSRSIVIKSKAHLFRTFR